MIIDYVFFRHAEKHQGFLEVDIIILGVRSQKYHVQSTKNKKFAYLYNISRKT